MFVRTLTLNTSLTTAIILHFDSRGNAEKPPVEDGPFLVFRDDSNQSV